ncbi:MAG: hypothetical protein GY714_29330 [Desulfobacterales bacterium]|nr:hypothetical protein [Desulfobacterales bacterium]MCP4160065.1 hypothetical protein [Deltaproteobacteria bacterium]
MYATNSEQLRKYIRENPGTLPSQYLNDNSLAASSYDNKTEKELIRLLNGDADVDECSVWNLSHEEWRINTEMALIALTHGNIY